MPVSILESRSLSAAKGMKMDSRIKTKQPARDEIKAQMSEYLLNGGKIEQCKSEESTPNYCYKAWDDMGLRESNFSH